MLDEWPLIERIIPNFDVVVERTEEGQGIKLNVEKQFSVDGGPDDSFNSLLEGMMADSTADDSHTRRAATRLSHEQEQVLKLITGPSVVQDLIDSSGMNEFDTCRSLYDLINIGLVQTVADELSEAARVVEKEADVPTWVPASLISILTIISFIGGWNPANSFFSFPTETHAAPNVYELNTRYQLQHVVEVVDIFFIQEHRLPIDLSRLVDNGYLRASDIRDAYGRPFSYQAKQAEMRFNLTAEGRNNNGRPITPNGRKITAAKGYLSSGE